MDLERSGVFVPRPAPARGGDAPGPWPRPVYEPGAAARDRELARGIEEALAARPGVAGPAEDPGDVTPLFRDPALVRRVVDRFAREARERRATVVVAVGAAGGLLGSPLAVHAELPLVPVTGGGRLAGAAESLTYEGPAGEETVEAPTGALGEGDRALLVGGVLGRGAALSAACDLVERTGAAVGSLCVLVELRGRGGREMMSRHNLLSLLSL